MMKTTCEDKLETVTCLQSFCPTDHMVRQLGFGRRCVSLVHTLLEFEAYSRYLCLAVAFDLEDIM